MVHRPREEILATEFLEAKSDGRFQERMQKVSLASSTVSIRPPGLVATREVDQALNALMSAKTDGSSGVPSETLEQLVQIPSYSFTA